MVSKFKSDNNMNRNILDLEKMAEAEQNGEILSGHEDNGEGGNAEWSSEGDEED